MAQFFAALSADPQIAKVWQTRGTAKLEQITSLREQHAIARGGVALALLPGLRAPATEILDPEQGRYWAGGVGSWSYDGQAGVRGLQRFHKRLAETKEEPGALFREAEGLYCLFFGDANEPNSFWAATDRLGALHVYVAELQQVTLVSTSSLAIACLLRPQWDPVALRQFFAYGNVFDSRTLFQGISKLPPGSLFHFKAGGGYTAKQYWKISDYCHDRIPPSGSVGDLADSLKQSMQAISRNFARPVLDLTGGFDSRALFGAMLASGLQFQTVTSGSESDPDVQVAKKLASEFSIPHLVRPRTDVSGADLWSFCQRSLALLDGEADVLTYAGTLRSHLAQAEEFDVTINGSVGEICKGQWWEALFPNVGRRGHWKEDVRTIALKRFAYDPHAADLLDFSYPDSLLDDFSAVIEKATAETDGLPNTALVDTAYLALRMQRWQGRLSSATLRIWPCWSPFASGRALEIALSTPISQRIRHRMTRRLIEHQSDRLARIPLATGYPASPLRVSNAHRFAPLLGEVGRSVIRHAGRRLGLKKSPATAKGGAFAKLWAIEEVRELLDPTRMLTRQFYQAPQLDSILRSGGAAGPEQSVAGKILTLEMVARTLAQ